MAMKKMNANTKLVIGGIGTMMMLQNYSFFLGYWNVYKYIPEDSLCDGIRFWTGYDAVVCATETVFACGMMLGAWWNRSSFLWWFFTAVHVLNAVPGYTGATIFLGVNIYSDEGKDCVDRYPTMGDAISIVWTCQAVFYLFYCGFMIALCYIVVLRKPDEEGPFLGERDNDKLIILALGLMMMVQNFAFGVTYWDLYMMTDPDSSKCEGTRFWLGYDAVVCVIETVFAGCMMLGGLVDDSKVLFWVFWVLHALDAVPGYTGACIFLGKNLMDDDGKQCRDANPGIGDRSVEVWTWQLIFYVFYVFCMFGQTYMSGIRRTKNEYNSAEMETASETE